MEVYRLLSKELMMLYSAMSSPQTIISVPSVVCQVRVPVP